MPRNVPEREPLQLSTPCPWELAQLPRHMPDREPLQLSAPCPWYLAHLPGHMMSDHTLNPCKGSGGMRAHLPLLMMTSLVTLMAAFQAAKGTLNSGSTRKHISISQHLYWSIAPRP